MNRQPKRKPVDSLDQSLDQSLEQLLESRQEQLKSLFPVPAPTPKTSKVLPGLGIALVLGGWLFWADPAYRQEQLHSEASALRSLTLNDGSQVILDKSSRMTVSWHLFSRRVDLQAGQALFDVAHSRYRPFVVSAGALDVRVLGTRFNVLRLDQQRTQVTLERGSVQVSGRDQAGAVTQLVPGDQAAFKAGQLATLNQIKVSDAMAWKDDQLVFQRMPLGDALTLINRYRSRAVRFDDPALSQLTLNGVFDSRQTDQLLELLPSILPVRLMTQTDGTVTIVQK